jgi:hypothetical protein
MANEIERELQEARAQAEAGWGRYYELRRRRAVRAALALSRLKPGAKPVPRPATHVAPAAPAPAPTRNGVAHCWDLGHVYSPVADTVALAQEPLHSQVWPAEPRIPAGIDWRDVEQVALVRTLREQEPMVFPTAPTGDESEFFIGNSEFSALDAWALQAVLRQFRPRRMIEVGSGFSSLVTARVNREHLGGELDFTCIEPYPREFLRAGVDGISRLIIEPVQAVDLDVFAALGDGDILFIDSAHVTKTGNDVNRLYLDVLPRLQPGVIVHVHDIFFPHDYPQEWVMVGRGWNEQYLLQAFLTFNQRFEILFGNAWMRQFHPDVLPHIAGGGGSFWMRSVQ